MWFFWGGFRFRVGWGGWGSGLGWGGGGGLRFVGFRFGFTERREFEVGVAFFGGGEGGSGSDSGSGFGGSQTLRRVEGSGSGSGSGCIFKLPLPSGQGWCRGLGFIDAYQASFRYATGPLPFLEVLRSPAGRVSDVLGDCSKCGFPPLV